MKNKCASMLLASLCLGVLLTGCGKASDTGENTAPAQAAEGTQKDAANKESAQKEAANKENVNKENVNKENGSQEEKAAKQDVRKLTFVLDWTPNTNHTGIYVAREKGYFKDAGLEVEIVQPPENGAEVLAASGKAQFAMSFQDSLAPAFSGDNPLPVTAVAGVIQHNTSGIISRKGEGMDRPRGLEGKKYATWDLPVEKATIKDVMEADGGDFGKVELIPSTVTDEVTALRTKSVDAIWIFYAWAGVKTELEGLETDYFAFADLDSVFDFYTPVIIANNTFLANEPETARAFLDAVSRGYEFAIEHPQEAGDILCRAAPELDPELVKASQEYLADKYRADAPKWGYIDQERWDAYYAWLNEKGLTETPIEAGTGFSNEYLP